MTEALAKDFQFPFIKDEKYNQYIQKFMFSFKNIYSENINASNVMFLTGASKQGKSWLLRYNIRKFQSSQQNPMIFYYDAKEISFLNFEMFLYSFEKMIINTLVLKNKEMLETKKTPLISDEELMKVIFRFYDKNLFEQDLAKCLDKATNNYSMSAVIQINTVDDKKDLRVMLEKYRNKDYKDTPLLDNFDKISEIVSRSEGHQDKFQAKIKIIYDVLIRKEQERKPPQYYHTSQFRNGIDVQNFFLDLINHISGYTDKYYNETADKIEREDLIYKYRADKEKYDSNINDSPLLGDKHMHSLMVIESVQEIMRMRGCDQLARDYIDTLILRLQINQPKWYRNHFPVIIETNMSQYFNEEIYNDIQQPEFYFNTVEFLGYQDRERQDALSKIYNRDQIELIEEKLGRSVYHWNIFTEIIKGRREDETFDDLLELDNEAFEKVQNEFKYRLNKLYTHPLLGDLLDNGDVDYAILDCLETLHSKKDYIIYCRTDYARQEFLKMPIIQAMFDLNILYKSKYYEFLYVEHRLFRHVIGDFVKEKKENMNRHERIRYKLYQKIHGLKFGSKYSGVPLLTRENWKQQLFDKSDENFETRALYYHVLKPEDYVRPLYF